MPFKDFERLVQRWTRHSEHRGQRPLRQSDLSVDGLVEQQSGGLVGQ